MPSYLFFLWKKRKLSTRENDNEDSREKQQIFEENFQEEITNEGKDTNIVFWLKSRRNLSREPKILNQNKESKKQTQNLKQKKRI